MTVARVAQLTGLSPGMLSKIENGNAFPSLTTLHALSRVFKVPMTYFFETHEETQGCCYVKKDGGLFIESRGSKVGADLPVGSAYDAVRARPKPLHVSLRQEAVTPQSRSDRG